jgi:hypothetical protein
MRKRRNLCPDKNLGGDASEKNEHGTRCTGFVGIRSPLQCVGSEFQNLGPATPQTLIPRSIQRLEILYRNPIDPLWTRFSFLFHFWFGLVSFL